MPNGIISARYAQSLFDLAKEQKLIEPVRQHMRLIEQTCKQNKILNAIFNNPNINIGKKKGIVTDLFSDKINQLTLQFILLLIEKRRVILLKEIASQLGNIYNQYKGIKVALLISAKPSSEQIKNKIISLLEKEFSCKIDLKEEIDESVIGGFKIMIEDKYYDATVLNQLNRLRKDLSLNEVRLK